MDGKRVANYYTNVTKMLLEASEKDGITQHFARLDLNSDGTVSGQEIRSELHRDEVRHIYEGHRLEYLDSYDQLLISLHEKFPSVKEKAECDSCPLTKLELGHIAFSTTKREREDMVTEAELNREDPSRPVQNAELQRELAELGEALSSFPPLDEASARRHLWEGANVPDGLVGRCDFPVIHVDEMSPSRFFQDFFVNGRPVIVRAVSRGWKAETDWQNRTRLNELYGDREFFVGSRPPEMGETRTMREYLDYLTSEEALTSFHPLYLWDDAIESVRYSGSRHPLEDTQTPPFITDLKMGGVNGPRSASVTMGPAGAGSHFHEHQDAYCVLVHGLKFWVLLDGSHRMPAHLIDGIGPQAFLNHLKRERGETWWQGKTQGQFECTQRPGDFIFVPSNYRHLVVNLVPSFAMNSEFRPDHEGPDRDRRSGRRFTNITRRSDDPHEEL